MQGTKIYYNLLLGALGGATAWYLLTGVLAFGGDAMDASTLAKRGAVVGACIGLCCAAYDTLVTGSFARIVRFCGQGMLLGLVAGAIALPLGQSVFTKLLGRDPASLEIASRLIAAFAGWTLLGAIIGAAEGVGKGTQVWKAMLGGVLGGAVGGIFFELFGRATTDAAGDVAIAVSEQQVVAFALTLLGASIGAAVAWVTTVLTDAWLSVTSGKLAGTTISVSKYVASHGRAHNVGVMGGSSWEANIFFPGDPEIHGKHAELTLDDGAPTLMLDPAAAKAGARLDVNGRDVSRWQLSDGDTIRIGGTSMVYRDKRK